MYLRCTFGRPIRVRHTPPMQEGVANARARCECMWYANEAIATNGGSQLFYFILSQILQNNFSKQETISFTFHKSSSISRCQESKQPNTKFMRIYFDDVLLLVTVYTTTSKTNL